MSARKDPRAQEPSRGKHFTEQRAKNRTACGRKTETGLTARPDCDVGSGVEEIVLITEFVNVRDTNDSRNRCTAVTSQRTSESMVFNSRAKSSGYRPVDLHGSHRQDDYDCSLFLAAHLQRPDQKYG
jgi:hypothetical protein